MAKLVFGSNQSLDGYVQHQEVTPGLALVRHVVEKVRDRAGSVGATRGGIPWTAREV